MIIRAALTVIVIFCIPAWGSDVCPNNNDALIKRDTHQQFPASLQPYEVSSSPGAGLGLFAATDLEIGTVILRESPILSIPRLEHIKGSGYPLRAVTEAVQHQLDLLPSHSQRDVLDLTFHSEPGELDDLQGSRSGLIFRTNAYNTGASGFGLFAKIARINHSCRPNVAYVWNERLHKLVIYATRFIHQGEEIFDSYIPLLLDHRERQKRLDRYGFRCTCAACSQHAHNLTLSDTRRNTLRDAFSAFAPQTTTLDIPSSRAGLRKARANAKSSLDLAQLVEEEGLADYYAAAYRIVAICHARIGEWSTAAVWSNKGFEARVREDAESEATREMAGLTRMLVEKWENDLLGKGNESL